MVLALWRQNTERILARGGKRTLGESPRDHAKFGEEMKKVWVDTLFGKFKGVIVSEERDEAVVQLVGYPFGSYPNDSEINVIKDNISERK